MNDKRPCHGSAVTYDALYETSRTPEFAEATEAARNMCGTCLLRMPDTARACLRENKGERWVKVVLGKKLRDVGEVQSIHPKRAEAAKGAHARANAARLESLRDLIASGCELVEVLDRLKVSRNALWKWCRKYGHGDEWEALAGPGRARENGYTKGRAA